MKKLFRSLLVLAPLVLAATVPVAIQAAEPPRAGAVSPIMTVRFYADVTSPESAHAAIVLGALLERHPDEVAVEFHHFYAPRIEAQSRIADLAIAAASVQGRGWDMALLVLANQDRHSLADLVAMARQLHLDLPQFEAALAAGDLSMAVADDAAKAATLKLPEGGGFVIGTDALPPQRLGDLESRLASLAKH